MFIQPVNDFRAFDAFLYKELNNVPLLHFDDKLHFFGPSVKESPGIKYSSYIV
jgi:hypothetical protein